MEHFIACTEQGWVFLILRNFIKYIIHSNPSILAVASLRWLTLEALFGCPYTGLMPFEMPSWQLLQQKGVGWRRSSAVPAQSCQVSQESEGFWGCIGYLCSEWILRKCHLHGCAQSHQEFLTFFLVLNPIKHLVFGGSCHRVAACLLHYAQIQFWVWGDIMLASRVQFCFPVSTIQGSFCKRTKVFFFFFFSETLSELW